MAAFLKSLLLCPWPNGTLVALCCDVFETRLGKLAVDIVDAVNVAAESSHALLQVPAPIAPSIGSIARVIVGGRYKKKFLDFHVTSRF